VRDKGPEVRRRVFFEIVEVVVERIEVSNLQLRRHSPQTCIASTADIEIHESG